MPVYEFRCNSCRSNVDVFTRSISAEVSGSCDRCGSTDLRRAVSRVVMLGIGGGDVDLEGMDPNDPRAMAAWARQMQAQMGPDAGPEMEELAQKLERGESLDDDFDLHDAHDHGYDDF
jgi:putative FmdB family regulatory protein